MSSSSLGVGLSSIVQRVEARPRRRCQRGGWMRRFCRMRIPRYVAQIKQRLPGQLRNAGVGMPQQLYEHPDPAEFAGVDPNHRDGLGHTHTLSQPSFRPSHRILEEPAPAGHFTSSTLTPAVLAPAPTYPMAPLVRATYAATSASVPTDFGIEALPVKTRLR